MLSFDLREIESQPAHVSGELMPDDPVWEEGDTLPAGPIKVTGRLSRAGPGKFYFHGHLEGELKTECRRCLTAVDDDVDDELHLIFAEAGDADAELDPDVYQLDERAMELDLRPAVREQWLLLVPSFAVCTEDCKGLCPTCGVDRNVTSCDCAPHIDSRWDALRSAKSGHSRN